MAELTIFDVKHGSCALFIADTGRNILIDCGTNGTTGWSATKELRARGISQIDMLAITNCDEDHASGLPELRASEININSLWRAKNVSADEIVNLKAQHGMGRGIEALVDMARSYNAEYVPVDYGDLKREIFYNPPGSFADENNLSGVIILTINGVKFVFPGDMERSGFDALMERKEFRTATAKCGVLLAPHHGRECSVHDSFLEGANPFWTVISDGPHEFKSQDTHRAFHAASRGATFRGKERYVLSTRRDGNITFDFGSTGWSAS